MTKAAEADLPDISWPHSPKFVMARWQLAQAAAKEVDWEGDIRKGEQPYVSPLPHHDDTICEFLIAWKQDNNGSTFVASPYPLPWLEEQMVDYTGFQPVAV